jgi:hypothetical protein
MHRLSVAVVLFVVITAGGCPAPSAPAPIVAAPPSTPTPTPEQAIAVVEQFYARYDDALTPALTALFTDAQRARADGHRAQCAAVMQQINAGKDVDVPVACESDPYWCAQDTAPMAKPRFEAPGTVVVTYADQPAPRVKVAVKAIEGRWRIDSFTCVGGG